MLSKREVHTLQRAAIRRELSRIFPGSTLCYNSYHKPYLSTSPELSLSLSHSGSYVVIGVAPEGHTMGVDVEIHTERAEHVKSRFCSSCELHLLTRYHLPLVVLWSAKESVYKIFSERIRGFGKTILLKEIILTESAIPTLIFDVLLGEEHKESVPVHILRREDPTLTYAISPELQLPEPPAWPAHLR